MKRAGLIVSPVHKEGGTEGRDEEGAEEEAEDKDDYLLMSPNPSGLFTAHTYQNIVSSGLTPGQYREAMEEVAYMTPRPRDELLSIQSNSSTSSSAAQSLGEHSRLRQHHSASPPPLPGDHPSLQDDRVKRSLTLPSTSGRVRSQYSYVTEVSEIPTTVSSFVVPQPTLSTTVGMSHPPENQKPPPSGDSSRFPLKMNSLGDLDTVMREETDSRDQLLSIQPTARPRPRPKPRERTVSVPSPELSSKHQHKRPPSFPDPSLAEAVRGITLNGAHHQHSHVSHEIIEEELELREPLIPNEAPPVPERTYLSPVHKTVPMNPFNARHPENNILQAEFPDTPPELCQRALENYGYDVDKAREAVQIQILLGMNIPHMKAEDCKRALAHCQWKIDRAAGWLVERSEELESKRT